MSNVIAFPNQPTCELCGERIDGAPAWIDGKAWHPWTEWATCSRRALRNLADNEDHSKKVTS